MAETFTVASLGTSFAQNKCMLGVYNGAGSGKVVRLYRAFILNNQTVAVTGVMTTLELRRTSTGSGGTPIAPLTHDTANTAVVAQIAVATNQSVTPTDLFRRFAWSNDEPVANAAATLDELECLVPFGTIWDVGYGDANVEPIVLREGYGVALINVGNTAVGVADVFFEITIGAS